MTYTWHAHVRIEVDTYRHKPVIQSARVIVHKMALRTQRVSIVAPEVASDTYRQ